MGVRDWLRKKEPKSHRPVQERTPTLRLYMVEREFSPRDNLTGRGFVFRDAEDRAIRHDEEELEAIGIQVINVAGVSYRKKELQSKAFDVGARLRLVPDPKNKYDKNAVGVFDEAGKVQCGFVPKELAAEISTTMRQGQAREALVLWEWRDGTGERVALKMLVAPQIGPIMRTLGDEDDA